MFGAVGSLLIVTFTLLVLLLPPHRLHPSAHPLLRLLDPVGDRALVLPFANFVQRIAWPWSGRLGGRGRRASRPGVARGGDALRHLALRRGQPQRLGALDRFLEAVVAFLLE